MQPSVACTFVLAKEDLDTRDTLSSRRTKKINDAQKIAKHSTAWHSNAGRVPGRMRGATPVPVIRSKFQAEWKEERGVFPSYVARKEKESLVGGDNL